MYRKQGYALLEIVIILTFTVLILGSLFTLALDDFKLETLGNSKPQTIDLLDYEVEFLNAIKEKINSKPEYIEAIKIKDFTGEIGNYISIDGYLGMKIRFIGEYLYWTSYKEELGNSYTRVLTYEITDENLFKVFITNRIEVKRV